MFFLIHLRVGLLGVLLGGGVFSTTHAQTAHRATTSSQPAKTQPAAKTASASTAGSPGAKPSAGRTSTRSAPAPMPPTGGIKPEDRARQMTTSMTQALGLALAQTERVQAINLQAIQRVEEARRTFARNLPRMHAEIDLIGTSRLTFLKDVLTEQQFRAYAAMREKKMGIPEALKQQAAASESGGE